MRFFSLKQLTLTSKPPWEPGASLQWSGSSQGHHPDNYLPVDGMRIIIFDGCQQLTVKEAENVAEGLTLDWVRVDLQGVAL